MRYLICVFTEGMLALVANKFRAILTMLGIIIGVCAIVAVVSIGDSGKRRIMDEMEKIAQPTASAAASDSLAAATRSAVASGRGASAEAPAATHVQIANATLAANEERWGACAERWADDIAGADRRIHPGA